ncbi:metal ABC transporter permease [Ketobacter alkanivorans]|uniref:Metal ABC transporter permease n=2 Tax=Ketobacter alkanivorans TaxID=1917421 RepID=A0A2K9LR48_9GAMM|nr:metal ABC transporter permease [Ketobacter alkanivorans]
MYGAVQRSNVDWRVLAKLVPYLWLFRIRVGFALVLLIIAKLANVGVPVSLKYIVDSLDKSLAVQAVAVPVAMVFAYGILRFSSVLFGELRDAVFGRVAERTLSRLGLTVFEHLHRLDLEYHLSRKTGGLSRDIERGTSGVSFLLRSLVFSVVPILVEVALVIAIFALQFDLIFVWITLFAVVVYIGFSVVVTNWRTEFVRAANMKDNQANTRAIDSLLNYETVKYFNNEHYESKLYAANLLEREQAKVTNHLSLAALNSGQALIIASSIAVMMLIAAYQVQDGLMTLGDLAMINALMIQVFIPLNALGFVYREMKRALADVEGMFDILDVTPAIQDSDHAEALPVGADGIRFDNVSFSYHPDRPILKNVSFTVPAGKKVAIVGPSGAGKSTIARLLFRFYEANEGDIYIGDHAVRDLTQDSLRAAIGVVPQDTVLFNDTLQENIRYGRPDASEQEILDASQHAMLSAFIEKLPKGYNTLVGERGLKVSGGEKQRIAIARTLLKRPRIFLFDESTSSLDSRTEQAINQSLQKIARDHTTLMIAHRLSTVVDCDEIIVLEEGEIVERGSHDDLLKQSGRYQDMWRVQMHSETE